MKDKRAVLVVSFGTTYENARRSCIEGIEKEIGKTFADQGIKVYRAFTSNMIIRILKEKYQIETDTVEEALLRMERDGVKHVIVQPTHIIDGIENTRMKEVVSRCQEHFESISMGEVLLSKESDYVWMAEYFSARKQELAKEQTLVLMGHGSSHKANESYQKLNHLFEKMQEDIFVATVEAEPDVEDGIAFAKKSENTKVMLLPFMIVAGDHAHNDMAGDEEDSWVNRFRVEGFEVSYVMEGLGEQKEIRTRFAKKVEALISKFEALLTNGKHC
ncbi:MAG: sirohydrochlorin cobaltochelatase [Lachnospiraceae bacterium]|nr:sirohydrochlorin cobaltochelatase [Lachnospiraceae bacterium]